MSVLIPPSWPDRAQPRRRGRAAPCYPRCECGQEEEPFPSFREAVRVLEGYGWRHAPMIGAWDDDAGWRPGFGWRWYCPPCRARWESARVRAQKEYRRRTVRRG